MSLSHMHTIPRVQKQASDSTRIQNKEVCSCHLSPLRLQQMLLMENTSLQPTPHLTFVLPTKCAGSLPITERKFWKPVVTGTWGSHANCLRLLHIHARIFWVQEPAAGSVIVSLQQICHLSSRISVQIRPSRWQIHFCLFVCLFLFWFFFFLRQGFSVYPWLSWNSIWTRGWPWTQIPTCLCLPSAGITGVTHTVEQTLLDVNVGKRMVDVWVGNDGRSLTPSWSGQSLPQGPHAPGGECVSARLRMRGLVSAALLLFLPVLFSCGDP